MTEVRTSCRICAGQCGLRLTLDEAGAVQSVRGDKDNPVTLGYACIKGLTLHEAHASPQRLLHPLKRQPDGGFARIPLAQALDEIAERLQAIQADSGADAIAGFRGTMSYTNLLANHMLPSWLRSFGSSSFYSTMTVDQSAKWVSFERLGGWAAGRDAFALADVLLLVGTNPLVSLSTFNVDLQHPVKRLQEAKARGLKLVVIDPRRSETARHADVFLQPLPGEDVTVIAGLLHLILERGWHDAAFCARWVDGLDALQAAVAPFTPAMVDARAGVPQADLLAAAQLFAQPLPDRLKRGSAGSGTGPNMGPNSNLAEHLIECLNVVCGRYARAGDAVPNPGVIGARHPRRAQVIAPRRSWEQGPRSRVRALGSLFGERMSGALADEILTPGEGRIRALIVDGGNPVIALPGQAKTEAALRALDLLVTIDPFLSATAQLSHYVLPPTMMWERPDIGSRDYEAHTMMRPYAQYAPPVLQPPAGSELVDDWAVFFGLAQRMSLPLQFDGVPLDLNHRYSSEELLALLLRHSAVPFEKLRDTTQGGRLFELPPEQVQPAEADANGRFAVAPADVVAELTTVRQRAPLAEGCTHRLAVRRLRDVQNTMFHALPTLAHRFPENPAFLHPDDLSALGWQAGQRLAIRSAHGEIELPVKADDSLRRGVVSVPHGWGGLLDDSRQPGANTNRLTSADVDLDPINAMPVLTGLPVRLRCLPA